MLNLGDRTGIRREVIGGTLNANEPADIWGIYLTKYPKMLNDPIRHPGGLQLEPVTVNDSSSKQLY